MLFESLFMTLHLVLGAYANLCYDNFTLLSIKQQKKQLMSAKIKKHFVQAVSHRYSLIILSGSTLLSN